MSLLRPALLAIAVVALAAAPAHTGRRIGIEVHGSMSAFAMDEMNDSLASFNELLGTSLDDIEDGRTWGIALRLWPHPDLLMRLAWERIEAESEDSGVTFDMDANAYTIGGTWFAPTHGALRYGLGLSVGGYFADAAIKGSQASFDATGWTVGVSPSAETMLRLGENLSLSVAAGYRWATIEGLSFNEEYKTDLEVDYRGGFLRLSIAAERTPR